MSRARWECPNGCPGVLGPTRPSLEHACRFCLTCSAKGDRMVRRVPAAAVRQRAAKQAEKQEAKVAERARKAQLDVERKRRDAADYTVEVAGESPASVNRRTCDDLKEALRYRRHLARAFDIDAKTIAILRVKNGRAATARFHGQAFAGWEFEDGTNEAS